MVTDLAANVNVKDSAKKNQMQRGTKKYINELIGIFWVEFAFRNKVRA